MERVSVVPVTSAHRPRWEILYAGYAAFYRVEQTPEMRETVWNWLMDPAREVWGLVALDGAADPIGLTHFRTFARPLSATTGLFLDDLFVDPGQRGGGIADALIGAVADRGREMGCSVVRWITAENNYRARGVYDRLATRTPWVTYDIKL